MDAIPTYTLYGEQDYATEPDWLHWETVLSRSRLYGFRIAPHRHEQFFQVLHLTRGTAEVTIDDITRHVEPPVAIIIPALPVHGFVFSEDVEGVVVTLFERDVRAALADMPEIDGCLRVPHVITDPNANMAQVGKEVAALIAEADASAPGRALAMRARITSLLVELYRAVLASTDQPYDAGNRALRYAQAFHRLIEQEYRNHQPIDFYAAALGITPPHLNRICRTIMGVSALKVIERRVLLEAKRYLTFSSLSVKEIAALLGYADPGYFNRMFRREVGTAPGKYRQYQ
jgi:AraC family transcriptional activator of pobA